MDNVYNTTLLNIEQLEPNVGQVEGLPTNPRTISGEKVEDLKKSLLNNPEMMYLRECIVYPFNGKYVIIGGNQRYTALSELGQKQIPCKILAPDTPVEKLRAIVLKDNYGYGEWDKDILAEEWDLDEIASMDMESILGFADGELSETEETTDVQPTGDGGVEAFGAHSVVLRFGGYKSEMTEEEFVWLRNTFMKYKNDSGTTDGFVEYIKGKVEYGD